MPILRFFFVFSFVVSLFIFHQMKFRFFTVDFFADKSQKDQAYYVLLSPPILSDRFLWSFIVDTKKDFIHLIFIDRIGSLRKIVTLFHFLLIRTLHFLSPPRNIKKVR
jgi:hypothetical protein